MKDDMIVKLVKLQSKLDEVSQQLESVVLELLKSDVTIKGGGRNPPPRDKK